MSKKGLIAMKWIFVVLFTTYVSGISFFTHTHIHNYTVYVHSHPYKKGEKHNHTEKQLIVLDSFYKTVIISDIIPKCDVTDYSHPITTLFADFRNTFRATKLIGYKQLRAPPVAA